MSFGPASTGRTDQSPIEHGQQSHQHAPSLTEVPRPLANVSSLHADYETALAAVGVTTAAAAAAAAADDDHHGLEALRAAVHGPPPAPMANMTSPANAHYPAPDEPESYPQSSVTAAGPSPPPPPPNPNPKQTRLRRACDLCSQRKVKCDEVQPCKPCRDLQLDCTFNREMKRRGPPNKHAEAARAAKRPRLEPNISPGPHNAAETLVSIAGTQGSQGGLDGESIAPWPVLALMVDDFFTYIHPLTPFPHEPTFRQSFKSREDRTSREFLALLASMVGCLVASFPRTARLHLKAQHGMTLFPKAIHLIERCRSVALEARGPMFYNKDEVTVHDAATSYFLGLAAAYTMQWKVCKRFLIETMSFIRELGYHKPRDLGSSMFRVTYRGPPFDHVQDQIGKRIFWCMFLGVRSMSQLGSPQSEIILPPPTPSEPYPDFPVEVDDQFILPSQILGQPDGVVSLLTGFNQAVKVYMTMNPVVSIELSYGMTSLPFPDQKIMLEECLRAVKQVMDDIPHELSLNLNPLIPEGLPNPTMGGFGLGPDIFDDGHFGYHPPAYPALQPSSDIRHVMQTQPERRRVLQYEIQKANIYASQLATRSYYVERFFNLRDAHREHMRAQAAHVYAPDSTLSSASKSVAAAALQAAAEQADTVDDSMVAERELVVQNLITMLGSISQRNLEPNGGSLINKIRQVASTLVNDAPERKGPLAVKAEELLSRFVDILMRLEKTGPGSGGSQVGVRASDFNMTPQDEEEELRSWTDFREHQMRFYQNGGFMHQI